MAATKAQLMTDIRAALAAGNRAYDHFVEGACDLDEVCQGLVDFMVAEISGSGAGLVDADYGDITVSGVGTVMTIDAGVVTLAKMANIATDKLIGRDTAGTGVPEAIGLGASLSFDGSGNIQRAALTGDVTASANSNATTIANDAVTYAKMQNVSATNRILGRITAGSGDVEELTAANVLTITSGAVTNATNAFTGIQRSVVSTLTDGANIALDASLSNVYTVTLGGNRTLSNPTNVTAGTSWLIAVTQDGTGSRTLAYGGNYSFGAAVTPTLTTTASKTDIISCYAITTTLIACTILKGF